MSISFHSLHPSKNLIKKTDIKNWIRTIISEYNKRPDNINIIYVSDEYILEINNKYLNHNFFTDIITFNYNSETLISGDIFISVERVRENAETFKCSYEKELLRVIIHGIFHLLGFNDESKQQKDKMRKLEDDALKSFPKSIVSS